MDLEDANQIVVDYEGAVKSGRYLDRDGKRPENSD